MSILNALLNNAVDQAVLVSAEPDADGDFEILFYPLPESDTKTGMILATCEDRDHALSLAGSFKFALGLLLDHVLAQYAQSKAPPTELSHAQRLANIFRRLSEQSQAEFVKEFVDLLTLEQTKDLVALITARARREAVAQKEAESQP